MRRLKQLLLISFMSSLIVPQEVRLLDKQEIERKAAIIEKKMVRDRYIVASLTVLGHMYNVYIFLSFIAPLFNQSNAADNVQVICKICKKIIDESADAVPVHRQSFFKSVCSGVAHFGYNVKDTLTTSGGWLSIGQFSMYCVGWFSASFIAARIADSLVHPDTLRWYIAAHVPYDATVELLKDTVILLHDESLTPEEFQYNRELCKNFLVCLAYHGESLCAYMRYKLRHLEQGQVLMAHTMIERFVGVYNKQLVNIFNQLEAFILDYDQINECIAEYEKNISALIRQFYVIEGETKIDRRSVLELS